MTLVDSSQERENLLSLESRELQLADQVAKDSEALQCETWVRQAVESRRQCTNDSGLSEAPLTSRLVSAEARKCGTQEAARTVLDSHFHSVFIRPMSATSSRALSCARSNTHPDSATAGENEVSKAGLPAAIEDSPNAGTAVPADIATSPSASVTAPAAASLSALAKNDANDRAEADFSSAANLSMAEDAEVSAERTRCCSDYHKTNRLQTVIAKQLVDADLDILGSPSPDGECELQQRGIGDALLGAERLLRKSMRRQQTL
jgi:hypothetical protein